MHDFETLQVQVESDVLRVTLDRPKHANSINAAMLADLHRVMDLAESSPDCRLIVLQGANGVFCTGMDFADATASQDNTAGLAQKGGEAFLGLLKRLSTIPRAVVSLVDGRVAAGGVGIAAASDFVYATPRSNFALPEALWGLLPCCVLPFLIRRAGFQTAYTMTFSTLPIDSAAAHRAHLIDELVEDPEPLVRKLRARLTKLDPVTIDDLKSYLRQMWILTEDMERTAIKEFTRLMSSPVVQGRISGFASAQAFPWDKR